MTTQVTIHAKHNGMVLYTVREEPAKGSAKVFHYRYNPESVFNERYA